MRWFSPFFINNGVYTRMDAYVTKPCFIRWLNCIQQMWVFQKTQNIPKMVAKTIDRCRTRTFQITEQFQNDTELMALNIKTPLAEVQACMRSMRNQGMNIVLRKTVTDDDKFEIRLCFVYKYIHILSLVLHFRECR